MTALVSYAQNFEDVMLWRALKHVEMGRYIDIGAQGPNIDSVSKFFHEQGWQGIHVEPTPSYADQLRQERPDDIVLQAAVGNKVGTIKFYEFPDTGLSTDDRAIAKRHLKDGFPGREIVVPCITLDDVFSHFADKEIHWLKIDVEGGEQRVLKGWLHSPSRPWIVLIESTLPLTQVEVHKKWESIVIAKGYRFAYFDGLNRFYVAAGHDELFKAFSAGPNLFDGFLLSRNAWPWCTSLNTQIIAAEEKLQIERQDAATNLLQRESDLQTRLSASQAETKEKSLGFAAARDELMARLTASQQSALVAAGELLATEKHLGEKLATSQADSVRLAQELVARERDLAEQLNKKDQSTRSEIANVLAELAHLRESLNEKDGQLAAAQRASEMESLRFSQMIAAGEREFSTRLATRELELGTAISASQAELARVGKLLTAKEGDLNTLLQAHKQELLGHIQAVAVREREFGAQLLAMQQKAEKERAELTLVHDGQVRQMSQEHTKRENILGESMQAHRQELTITLRTIAQREQEFAAKLLASQTQANIEKADQIRLYDEQMRQLSGDHVVREKALGDSLQFLREELRVVEQERAKRERVHTDHIEQAHREWQREYQALVNQTQEFISKLTALQVQTAIDNAAQNRLRDEQTVTVRHLEKALAEANSMAEQQQAELGEERRRHLESERNTQESARKLKDEISCKADECQTLQKKIQMLYESSIESVSRLKEEYKKISAMTRATHTHIQQEMAELVHLADANSDVQADAPGHFQNTGAIAAALARKQAADGSETTTRTTLVELLAVDGSEFVNSVFRKILGRRPDANAAAFYVQRLEAGISKNQIVAEIRLSVEGRKRAVEIDGFEELTLLLVSPASNVDELIAHQGAAFVSCAYQTLLGRLPDSDGLKFYSDRLHSGISKLAILAEIRAGKEGREKHATCVGLDKRIRQYRLATNPLFGKLINVFIQVDGNSHAEVNARRMESSLTELRKLHDKATAQHHHALVSTSDRLEDLLTTIATLETRVAGSDANFVLSTSSLPLTSSILAQPILLRGNTDAEILANLAVQLNQSSEAVQLQSART